MLHKTEFCGKATERGTYLEAERKLRRCFSPALSANLPKIFHLLKLQYNSHDSVSGTQLESEKKTPHKKTKWPGAIFASGGSDSDHAIPHPPLHPTVPGQRS